MAERRLFDRPEAPHGTHDLLLVAAFAADDLEPHDVARATALVAGCHDCMTLAADLRLLTAASATLPAPAGRRRDFRLSQADAERLRPHGLRRVVGVFAGQHLQVARPLATGLTMLGIVGILVSSGPAFLTGPAAAPESASASAIPLAASGAPGSDFGNIASSGPVEPAQATHGDTSTRSLGVSGGQVSPDPTMAPAREDSGGPGERRDDGTGSARPSPLFVGSVVTLLAGVSLLGLSTLAIRRAR